eukprot:scaffold204690_cov75-Cyclotella_meneghiniana.AAC.6
MPRQRLSGSPTYAPDGYNCCVLCCSALPPPLPLQFPPNYILLLCINGGGELRRVAGPKANGRTSQTLCHHNSWVAATAAVVKAVRIPLFVAAYQRGGGGGGRRS